MGAVVGIVIAAFAFLAMSIALLLGKGSWLIAGFNTASAEKKAAFDRKKLCRAAGVLCLVVAVLLCAMAYLGYQIETGILAESVMIPFAIVSVVVVFAALIPVLRYMNTRCRK